MTVSQALFCHEFCQLSFFAKMTRSRKVEIGIRTDTVFSCQPSITRTSGKGEIIFPMMLPKANHHHHHDNPTFLPQEKVKRFLY